LGNEEKALVIAFDDNISTTRAIKTLAEPPNLGWVSSTALTNLELE